MRNKANYINNLYETLRTQNQERSLIFNINVKNYEPIPDLSVGKIIKVDSINLLQVLYFLIIPLKKIDAVKVEILTAHLYLLTTFLYWSFTTCHVDSNYKWSTRFQLSRQQFIYKELFIGMKLVATLWIPEMLATLLDETWTHHFQLGGTGVKVF